MSRAHISKAEIALWGVEHIKKAQQAKSKAVEKSKTKMKSAAHVVADVATLEHHPEWKKHVLEGRKKIPESASIPVQGSRDSIAQDSRESDGVVLPTGNERLDT